MSLAADTHILIWWLMGADRLSPNQVHVMKTVDPDHPLIVSDITLWEIAMLVCKGRITLNLPVREWLERAVAPPLVKLARISPAIAAEVAALPESLHGDPADRIIVSTARIHGAALITSDRRIIDSGVVPVQV
jgi:PIN domain nuclease of toxin-antitoxin system